MNDSSFLADEDLGKSWKSTLARSLVAVQSHSWCAHPTALRTDEGLGWGRLECCSLFLPPACFLCGHNSHILLFSHTPLYPYPSFKSLTDTISWRSFLWSQSSFESQLDTRLPMYSHGFCFFVHIPYSNQNSEQARSLSLSDRFSVDSVLSHHFIQHAPHSVPLNCCVLLFVFFQKD